MSEYLWILSIARKTFHGICSCTESTVYDCCFLSSPAITIQRMYVKES